MARKTKAKRAEKKETECCSFCGCDEKCCKKMKNEKDKVVKVYFCPNCRSKDVGYIFTLRNIFGILPKMRCRKCGYESVVFPQLVISGKKLDKLNKKYRGKNN